MIFGRMWFFKKLVLIWISVIIYLWTHLYPHIHLHAHLAMYLILQKMLSAKICYRISIFTVNSTVCLSVPVCVSVCVCLCLSLSLTENANLSFWMHSSKPNNAITTQGFFKYAHIDDIHPIIPCNLLTFGLKNVQNFIDLWLLHNTFCAMNWISTSWRLFILYTGGHERCMDITYRGCNIFNIFRKLKLRFYMNIVQHVVYRELFMGSTDRSA